MWSTIISIIFTAAAVKFALMFAYHSTDFEVHRNWMAITHNLPIYSWYFENTSQWTLDYPPLFAWFEWGLSQLAVHIDPRICIISATPYESEATVVFQRTSVIVTEMILFLSIWKLSTAVGMKYPHLVKRRFILMLTLFAFNYGLMIVDHIHFQYNGFLFGLLFISLAFIIQESYVKAALCFTFLLHMKHLFVYIAPVYFVYILFAYCFGNRSFSSFIGKTLKMILSVLVVTAVSLGPFANWRQLRQIVSRLFPFGRGLCHAYWAPNVWALYNTVDKVLLHMNTQYNFWPGLASPTASMTGGLVADVKHILLPSIRPEHTGVLVLLALFPNLLHCGYTALTGPSSPSSARLHSLLSAVVATSWAGFLFGWHVHEKAVLMFLLPMNILALYFPRYRNLTFYVTTLGHYSLMPLIPTAAETPVVVFLFLGYTCTQYTVFFLLHPVESSRASTGQPVPMPSTDFLVQPTVSGGGGRLFSLLGRLHLYGLVPLFVCTRLVLPLLPGWAAAMVGRHAFLPLMATSVYTAVGLCLGFPGFVYCSTLGGRGKPAPAVDVQRVTSAPPADSNQRHEEAGAGKKSQKKQSKAKKVKTQ